MISPGHKSRSCGTITGLSYRVPNYAIRPDEILNCYVLANIGMSDFLYVRVAEW